MIRVVDFNDYNYENIAFEIGFLGLDGKHDLKKRLNKDYINHLSRLKDANYFTIANCDLRDFKCSFDIHFESDCEEYVLAILFPVDGEWYFEIMDTHVKVDERWIMWD